MAADVPSGPSAPGDADEPAWPEPGRQAHAGAEPGDLGNLQPYPGAAIPVEPQGLTIPEPLAGAEPGCGQDGADHEARPAARAGRNLPAALAVGVLLGALALVTLFTIKATFLLYMGLIAGLALWELSRALGTKGILVPLPPVAIGGAAAVVLAYWQGERALAACLAVTVIAILAWRLHGETSGYLRDVTAGVLSLAYIPFMASFVALMLAVPDGSRRILVFLILTVCSDVGGYFAGILLGRHLMAPAISPKKTWEGFSGSALACLLAGAITLPILLGGAIWQGVLVGAGALAAATLGDLAESMIKRDLKIKDMGTVLPGHGGVLDRIDSLLLSAPVVWLLLVIFVPLSR